MDWKVIIILSTIGIIMGLLAVKGFTQKLEPFLWLFFGIVTSLVLSKNIDQKTFLHGLLIGLAWGIINGMTQSVFFDTYFANNPQLHQNFASFSIERTANEIFEAHKSAKVFIDSLPNYFDDYLKSKNAS